MFKNKTFIISGTSSGIGKFLTKKLLNLEASVIGLSRTNTNIKPNKNYLHYQIDLRELEKSNDLYQNILKNHGVINGIISNAGYGIFKNIENFSISEIQNFIKLNLTSHILLVRAFLPHMKKNKKGSIVFLGSEASLRGNKYSSIYSACKFGLRGFAQSLRKESSNKNLAVTIINPGLVKTNFFKKLNFEPGDGKSETIHPNDIAKIIIDVLSMHSRTIIDEINLSPLKNVIKKK